MELEYDKKDVKKPKGKRIKITKRVRPLSKKRKSGVYAI